MPTLHKLVLLLLACLGWGRAADAACGPLLPPAVAVQPKRAITASDLIELRDIGDAVAGNYGAGSRLAVSPDGRHVAFSLIRADLAGNGYCLGIFVSAIAPGATPRQIDVGSEPLPEVDSLRGYRVPTGRQAAGIPAWSPDGRWLAFLRRDQGITRLWVAARTGGAATTASRSVADVTAFAWSADSARLIFATTPGVADTEASNRREGESGWLYDNRISPVFGPAPLAAADLPQEVLVVGPTGGAPVAAMPDDIRRLASAPAGAPMPLLAIAGDGRRAAAMPQGTSPLAPLALTVTDAAGRMQPCKESWCRDGTIGLWWLPGRQGLLILRREGWNKGEITLYRWKAGQSARAVLRTSDDLQDCGLASASLVCSRESAVQPRRIVVIDTATGGARVLFDPNREFANIRLGTVQRLKARNSLGLESWADLVLPPGHRAGDRLPMVVVQYHSDGFLRGGTGDEYPVHLLAAQGFAVLSFEAPPFVAAAYPQAQTAVELNALNLKDWAERRSILSSVETQIDLAIATGAVDPGRIGITGLSDGASTVQFAMINSQRFAAAAISSCCFDPGLVTTYGGTALSDFARQMGIPGLTRKEPGFWKAYSLAVSGNMTSTPLLMQLADREYLGSLETFQALREFGKPVEMYVFPDEYHIKYQPRHRLAIYQRTLDWFGFWLQDRTSADPARQAQFKRWQAMRTALKVSVPPSR